MRATLTGGIGATVVIPAAIMICTAILAGSRCALPVCARSRGHIAQPPTRRARVSKRKQSRHQQGADRPTSRRCRIAKVHEGIVDGTGSQVKVGGSPRHDTIWTRDRPAHVPRINDPAPLPVELEFRNHRREAGSSSINRRTSSRSASKMQMPAISLPSVTGQTIGIRLPARGQTPSAAITASPTFAPEYCCCPVISRPSRTTKALNNPP